MTIQIPRLTHGYYYVLLNGERVGARHRMRDEAIEHAYLAKLLHPAADVEIESDRIRVDLDHVADDRRPTRPADPPTDGDTDAPFEIPADARVINVSAGERLLLNQSGTPDAPLVYIGSDDDRRTPVERVTVDGAIGNIWLVNLDVVRGIDTTGGPVAHMLIENCRVTHPDGDAISLQWRKQPELTRDITLRRCIVHDAAGQGIWAYKVRGLAVDNCVLINNGQNGNRTHNAYLKECSGLLFQRVFSARASGQGLKLSSDVQHGFDGGTVQECLFYDQDLGITLSHTTENPTYSHRRIALRRNTLIKHRRGIKVLSVDGLEISDTVISGKHRLDNQPAIALLSSWDDPKPQLNIAVTNTAISDWPMEYGRDRVADPLGAATIENTTYSETAPANLPDCEAILANPESWFNG